MSISSAVSRIALTHAKSESKQSYDEWLQKNDVEEMRDTLTKDEKFDVINSLFGPFMSRENYGKDDAVLILDGTCPEGCENEMRSLIDSLFDTPPVLKSELDPKVEWYIQKPGGISGQTSYCM